MLLAVFKCCDGDLIYGIIAWYDVVLSGVSVTWSAHLLYSSVSIETGPVDMHLTINMH